MPEHAPTSAPSEQTIRQTDDAGNRLPFTTVFPDRWSTNNDGTPYEPCTTVTKQVLRQFNLDPQSVNDAAVANHQTIRGCEWNFDDNTDNSLSQTVADGESLPWYRNKNRDSFTFLPDIFIDGRRILRFRITNAGFECTTAVQSGGSQVLTAAFIFKNTPPVDQLCEIPVNFLRATIDRIPR